MSDGKLHLYSGIFCSEPATRFSYILQCIIGITFSELYSACMPSQPRKYKECLDMVKSWEGVVVMEELQRIVMDYPDFVQLFRGVFVAHANAYCADKHEMKLHKVPDVHVFLHTYLKNIAARNEVRSGQFFTQNFRIVDKCLVSMEAGRVSLHEVSTSECVTYIVSQPLSHDEDAHKDNKHAHVYANTTRDNRGDDTESECESCDSNASIDPHDSVSNINHKVRAPSNVEYMGNGRERKQSTRRETQAHRDSVTVRTLSSVTLSDSGNHHSKKPIYGANESLISHKADESLISHKADESSISCYPDYNTKSVEQTVSKPVSQSHRTTAPSREGTAVSDNFLQVKGEPRSARITKSLISHTMDRESNTYSHHSLRSDVQSNSAATSPVRSIATALTKYSNAS